MLKLNELIGKDLTRIMKEKNISDYYIHTNLKVCSHRALTYIKKGNIISRGVPLSIILNIYKALGETEINIKDDNNALIIKF